MAEGPIDTRITELEHRLDRLRVAFEQHFLGNERLPPVAERDKFMRDLRAIDPTKVSAVPRFRLANLTARVSTYDTHWQKSLRAIEEGTVKNKAGQPVRAVLTAALFRVDGRVAYPVQDNIPVLLPDEAITLDAP